MRAWKAVSKQATAGTPGSAACASGQAGSDFGWCRGARSVRARSSRLHLRVDGHRLRNRVPPCTIRCPTASTGPTPGTPRRPVVRRPGPRRREVLGACHDRVVRVEDAELHAARPGVDDQNPHRHPRSCRPGPVRGPRGSPHRSAGCRRGPQPLGRACAGAERAPRAPRRGHPVDHVHDQVEPVEVVQHHHVERRGRGALLVVAADVDVVVVGPAVGQPVDQPRVPVEGEHDRGGRW